MQHLGVKIIFVKVRKSHLISDHDSTTSDHYCHRGAHEGGDPHDGGPHEGGGAHKGGGPHEGRGAHEGGLV